MRAGGGGGSLHDIPRLLFADKENEQEEHSPFSEHRVVTPSL